MENFKLTNFFTIKGISAASGLVYSQNVLFVISDSSSFLYQYDIDKKLLLKFPLVKDAKENIEKENMLVITDDLNLAFGTIRIKTKGSDGGHNGLKNIQLLLNSTEYPRYRFGISDAFKKGQQVDYVLGEWSEEEKEKLKERLEISTEIIKSFALAGLNNTMNTYNGK